MKNKKKRDGKWNEFRLLPCREKKKNEKKEINSFSELLEYREQRIYIKRPSTMHITRK